MLEFLKQLGAEDLIDMKKVTKIEREFYLIPSEIKNTVQKVKKRPVYAGIYLGKQKKQFHPSVCLLELLSKRANIVTVNKNGAWLFICSRDLWGKSIVSGKASVGELVLIANESSEILGYGKVVAELSAKKLCIQNIFDIGDLIRRERKK